MYFKTNPEAVIGGVLWKKLFLKVSQNSHKTLLLESLFINVAGSGLNLIKKRLQRRYFPMNFVKFLRTMLLTEHFSTTASVNRAVLFNIVIIDQVIITQVIVIITQVCKVKQYFLRRNIFEPCYYFFKGAAMQTITFNHKCRNMCKIFREVNLNPITFTFLNFISGHSFILIRSSRSQMFFKIGVLKNFTLFTGKHLCWSLFCNKVAGIGLELY